MIQTSKVLTPDQAAEYLQVNRETVYRYIRGGKLIASRLGRSYRIPKKSLDMLLWATRTQDDIELRDYTESEIADFIGEDRINSASQKVIDTLASPEK